MDAELEARIRDQKLREFGLLDPDQSTETSHNDYVKRVRAPFSPVERQLIRYFVLGKQEGGGE